MPVPILLVSTLWSFSSHLQLKTYVQQLNNEKELSCLQQIGEKHCQLRSSAKTIADVSAKRDKVIHDQHTCKFSCDLELKKAVKFAKKEEREYLSKVKAEAAKEVAASECRINAQKLLIDTLTERIKFAENEAALAKQQAK